MTYARRYLSYGLLFGIVLLHLTRECCSFLTTPPAIHHLRSPFSVVGGSRPTLVLAPLASSFYGKFDDLDEDEEDDDEEDDDEEDEDDDDEDYDDFGDLDVASFRSKMTNLYGSDDTEESGSAASSVDELISFARGLEDGASPQVVSTDWAIATDRLEPGTVLVANPAKFCADFGDRRTTPSPSLLAKFGLTLPPPADLGADRRADLLPVLILVQSNANSGGLQAVLMNRRTGYLLGDLENPESGGNAAPLLEKFCIQPLWFGGVDNVSSGLDMLHQCPAVDGAVPLSEDGLYWGGDPNQAQDAMEDSSLDRVYTGFDFKFYVQSTVWSKGELEKHMEAENWFSAKVSKEVLFKSRDRMGTRMAKPLWTEIMDLLGSPCKHVRDELYKDEL